MSTDLLVDYNGKPSVIGTGTKGLVVGTSGAGNFDFMTNGVVRKKLLSSGAKVGYSSLTNLTTAGAETYTAAQLATGIITRDPNGAGRTDTTDTAANIIALGLDTDGQTLTTYLINTADAAEAITLAGGTGVTISNVGQTVAQNESAILIFRRTSSTAVTLYILGA